MKKHIKWLRDEINLWVIEGIIGPDQGTALKLRYPAPAEGTAWGRIIFFSIGALGKAKLEPGAQSVRKYLPL